jgi:ABC-2 type transport system ATP-binding protein
VSKPLLNIDNISKSFLFKKVLTDVSLKLHPGKFYTLVGENGAGKSTIFKIIVGLECANSGEGSLLGENLTEVSASNKHRIGIVSEQIELDGPLNMRDFYRFYSAFFPKWDHELFKKIVKHQRLDLSQQFKKYSRGEKMQLVLIAELCKSPDILLIDEITSVLDVYGRQFYLQLFKDYANKKNGTIFLTTNIITEVSHFLDHVFVLKNGRLVFDDKKENISRVVCRISKSVDINLFPGHVELPQYNLVASEDVIDVPEHLISSASTEDLFLFLYRVRQLRGAYAKAS